jgi:hypothetical protein
LERVITAKLLERGPTVTDEFLVASFVRLSSPSLVPGGICTCPPLCDAGNGHILE